MALDKYRSKRDFDRTPEPRGRPTPDAKGNRFVVHKHDARNLHYDLRLEMDGEYQSWAVPKGPSLDPSEKRLAVHVEEHPLEYGEFEGVIPEGEYGGGTVLLWDRGRWDPVGNPKQGLEKGDFKFELAGEKLKGRFVLVRLRTAQGEPDPKNWLLIKEKDAEARLGSGEAVLLENPLSVQTGRSLQEIADDRDRVWSTAESRSEKSEHEPAKSVSSPAEKRATPVGSVGEIPNPEELPGAKAASIPQVIAPQLATLAKEIPESDRWIHEIKYDGYRGLVRVEGDSIKVLTRNGHDWTEKFHSVAEAMRQFPVREGWFDGEVVVLSPDGTTSFQALQNSLRGGRRARLHYYVFDLLYLNGFDLRRVPLVHRKEALSELFLAGKLGEGTIRYSDHIVGQGDMVRAQASGGNLEGLLSKRADSVYRSTRVKAWLKIKFLERDDFVIGGFTDPSGARGGFGALLVGAYDEEGNLYYTGRVGTGFSDAFLDEFRKRLDELETDETPFCDPPMGSAALKVIHWIEPKLVAQIEYTGWTEGQNLRHPAFQGLREDLSPTEVRSLPEGFVPLVDGGPHLSHLRLTKAEAEAAKDFTVKVSSSRPISLMKGLRLTNPDRVFYPERSITKLGLCAFYQEIADWILPEVLDRPLSLVRCPQGVGGETFYQKHANDSVPDVVGRAEVLEKKDEPVVALYVDGLPSLIGLVQIGVLEIHVWGSKIDDPEKPDRMIFDLDPDPDLAWDRVVDAAVAVKEKLEDLGFVSFVKTTGGKGLHVVVPLTRRHDWAEVLSFSQGLSEGLARESPDRFTTISSKARRKGKIYLDFRRNTRGATAIAPFSTRAHPHATVAVPLSWDELSRVRAGSEFHMFNLRERLEELDEDPWEGIDEVRQSITKRAWKELGG